MAYSPLVDRIAPPTTKKWSSRAGAAIIGAVVHHWAGTSMGGYHRLVESRDKASVNYLILNDGTLIGSVDEKYRAWTSGSWAVDRKRVTIEVQNETGGPEWRVSAAALATLVRLLADLARRHGWKRITTGREVRGHREFAATSCPGPYLWPRLPEVAADAQRALLGSPPKGTSKPGTIPAPPKPSKGNAKHRAWQERQNRYGDAGLYVDGVNGPVSKNWKAWTKKLQRALPAWKGIGKLRVDGDYGPLTNGAVKTLQSRNGLYVDGFAQSKTLAFMRSKGSNVPNRPSNRP